MSGVVPIFLSLLGLFSAGTPSQARVSPPRIPAALLEIEKKYAKAKTLSAEFEQVVVSKSFGTQKKSSGKIYVHLPQKLRWETQSPDKNLLVSDGKTHWYYTPPFDASDKGQYIVRRAADAQSRIATALLSGAFSSVKGLNIKALGPDRFYVPLKKGSAGTVREAEITIDPKKNLITRVILRHQSGNEATIDLKDVELGVKLADDLFVFTPPEGAKKIEG